MLAPTRCCCCCCCCPPPPPKVIPCCAAHCTCLPPVPPPQRTPGFVGADLAALAKEAAAVAVSRVFQQLEAAQKPVQQLEAAQKPAQQPEAAQNLAQPLEQASPAAAADQPALAADQQKQPAQAQAQALAQQGPAGSSALVVAAPVVAEAAAGAPAPRRFQGPLPPDVLAGEVLPRAGAERGCNCGLFPRGGRREGQPWQPGVCKPDHEPSDG